MSRPKTIPFYSAPNERDYSSGALLAVYRSLFDHFLQRKMSWPELEAFAGVEQRAPTHPLKAVTHFAAMAFDIRIVSPRHDYQTLVDSGALAAEVRQPTLQDIDELLSEKRLVHLMQSPLGDIDEETDDDAPNPASASLLIVDRVDNNYLLHDPAGILDTIGKDSLVPRSKIEALLTNKQSDNEVFGFALKARRNLRLDQYVVNAHPELSRAYAAKLIGEGKVQVNGKPSKPGYKLREHDTIDIEYDDSLLAQIPDIELPILYEDDDCIVINKPVGVLVHNIGSRDMEATVASFLRRHLQSSMNAEDGQRAGIVHRLDRLTSGVMICAKTPEALSWLQRQFHDRLAKKTYAAVIKGTLDPDEAVIDMPIERNPKAPATFRVGANGKSAVTAYKVITGNDRYSLLELRPHTGRTHQLRVHLAHQGHPIVGDFLYNGEQADRLYLHARVLEIVTPNGQAKRFEAPIPDAFLAKTSLQ